MTATMAGGRHRRNRTDPPPPSSAEKYLRLQEIFFRAIQVTRNEFGASTCVGSNVVYRRRSMEHSGGITEVSYAEDVHTGIDAIRAGGRLAYIPAVLAAGLCPDNVNAYARQQYRWGAGTLSVGFTRRMWTAPLPLRGKLPYFSGSAYNIYTAVAVFITPMIPLVMLSLAPATIRLGNCLILLSALLTGFVLYPLWHMNDYRLRDALPLLRGWANALAVWDYSRGNISGIDKFAAAADTRADIALYYSGWRPSRRSAVR